MATSARPSVQASTSAGSASAFDVGLDSGMMIGRAVWAAMSRTICSVNAPACVEVPISIVGFTCADDVGQPRPAARSPPQPFTSSHGRA